MGDTGDTSTRVQQEHVVARTQSAIKSSKGQMRGLSIIDAITPNSFVAPSRSKYLISEGGTSSDPVWSLDGSSSR
jgi:hypothetical protein